MNTVKVNREKSIIRDKARSLRHSSLGSQSLLEQLIAGISFKLNSIKYNFRIWPKLHIEVEIFDTLKKFYQFLFSFSVSILRQPMGSTVAIFQQFAGYSLWDLFTRFHDFWSLNWSEDFSWAKRCASIRVVFCPPTAICFCSLFAAIILVVGLFYAIFRLTDFLSEPFEFSSLKTG